MANRSYCKILLAGRNEDIEHIAQNVKKYGYDWGDRKTPNSLKFYPKTAVTESATVDEEEWKKYARECREERIDFKSLSIPLAKIKRSVKDRLYRKYGCASWVDWHLDRWGTLLNMEEKERIPVEGNALSLAYFIRPHKSGPDAWFIHLCETYDLAGIYADAEPGDDFLRYIKFVRGEMVEEETTPFISPLGAEIFGLDFYFQNPVFCNRLEKNPEKIVDIFAGSEYLEPLLSRMESEGYIAGKGAIS